MRSALLWRELIQLNDQRRQAAFQVFRHAPANAKQKAKLRQIDTFIQILKHMLATLYSRQQKCISMFS